VWTKHRQGDIVCAALLTQKQLNAHLANNSNNKDFIKYAGFVSSTAFLDYVIAARLPPALDALAQNEGH
jgi:hypothetical protein